MLMPRTILEVRKMLRDVINTIDMISHSLSFAGCVVVFLGGAYIALHSRVIPKWAATSLWYIGLAALLNGLTILIDWTIGQMHPLSHFQIGTVTETLLILSIAGTVGLLFFNTVWQDYLGSRKRYSTPIKKPVVKKTTGTRRPYRKRVPKSDTLSI